VNLHKENVLAWAPVGDAKRRRIECEHEGEDSWKSAVLVARLPAGGFPEDPERASVRSIVCLEVKVISLLPLPTVYGLGAHLNNLKATLNHINTTVTNQHNTILTQLNISTSLTTLNTRVAASEYNGCVRAQNSQMRGADVSIAWVKSPADVLPQLGGQDRPPTTI